MDFKKGNDRQVVLLPALGLAIKFPRIYLGDFFIRLFYVGLSLKFWKKEIFVRTAQGQDGTMKHWLFRGIMNNWLEFCYYVRTRQTFLVPTYFSFFGLINFQQFSESCLMDDQEFWDQLVALTDREIARDEDVDMHHFSNPGNFSCQGNKWRIIDYGDVGVQATLAKYGQKILSNFDPNYSWDKRRQELEEAKRS
jgi:hypothetical protein